MLGDNMYFFKYFFITSILGFFIESFLWHGHESGILYGPWTPIYGIGSIVIVILSNKIFKKRNINGFLKFLILFIFCFLILTFIEFIGGVLIEKIFGFSFWDYTKYRFNIGKYICLEISLIWGLISCLFVFIKPFIDRLIRYIPNFIYYIFCILFLIDIFCTFIYKR